jgi:hypothetical protein
MYIAGMYSAAYFESDPRKVVEAGLACIPSGSPYAQVVSDVLAWSKQEPDWREVWRKIEQKWDKHDICPDGVNRPFNIDAKLNGAYVTLGLLYGNRDWQKTMETATRCGQDSDCNPASATGVLGAMLGYDKLPAKDKEAIAKFADTKFNFTVYSFNDIVKSTEKRALEVIRQAGGMVNDQEVSIPRQSPKAPKLELFPFGVPVKAYRADDKSWQWKGDWKDTKEEHGLPAKETSSAGSEVTLKFNGTGVALVSELTQNGGRADVYIDGAKSDLVADDYIVPNTFDTDLWRMFGLPPGEHTLRLVVRGDADPRSTGKRIMLTRALVYSTEAGNSK